MIISTVTNLYLCLCVCPSVCPPAMLCPRLFPCAPFTLHSATCAPVCLCCYCVCWLQFTQIWPYCRQVSLLWEVLQRDPGQQCDPGGRPGTATDVSYQARVAEHTWWSSCEIIRRFSLWPSFCGKEFQSQEQTWTELSLHSFLCAGWYQKSSLKRRKTTCWTQNREYYSREQLQFGSCLCDVSEASFCKETTEKSNVCHCRFVECKDCGRKMHQICVLHYDVIWPSG